VWYQTNEVGAVCTWLIQKVEVGAVSTWLIQEVEVWLSDSAIVVKIVWTLCAFHLKKTMVLAFFSVFTVLQFTFINPR
jgi:hypothetical protein